MSGRDEKPKLSVPKFASFKPQQPTAPEVEKKGEQSDRKRHRHSQHEGHQSKRSRHESRHWEDRRKDERHNEARADSKSVRKTNERQRSRSPSRRAERRAESHATQTKEVKSDHFFFDIKGDPLIIKYGGIERSKIPRYRRYGAGRVLGTPGRLIIHREGARDRFSLRMPGEGSAFFKDKDGLRSKTSRAKKQAVILRARKVLVDAEEDGDEGYLAVEKAKRKHRDSESESSGLDTRPDYRSIEGKAKAKSGLDFSSSDESDQEDDAIPTLDQSNPLKWRSIQLNRQVKDHPEDIAAWIELVDHQDVLLRAGGSLDHQVLENEAHSYAEIKVSMLESALPYASRPQDRVKVLNYLMREGIKVWNSKIAAKKWSEVLKDEEDNFELWKMHLDFSMSNIASFHFDDIKKMLLDRLGHALTGPVLDTSQAFGEAVYVFLRTTKFLHDAGYKELAVAAWQAMLELTFFRPPGLDGSKAALDGFEEFWESEVPRLGEANAMGWKHFVDSHSQGDAPEPLDQHPQQLEPTQDAYKAWANEERWQSQRARYPARTLDEGNDDDPFRIIVYSDVAPLLFFIPDEALPHVRHDLLDAFLIFSGLPPFSNSDKGVSAAFNDQFLIGGRLSPPKDGVRGGPEDQETSRKSPNFPSMSLRATITPELLFPGSSWYQYFPQSDEHLSPSVNLTQIAIKQLVQRAGVEDLALYCFGLSTLKEPAGLKKLAKGLLKQYPTNARLYNGYALAEHAHQNADVAKKVLSSATDLISKTSKSDEIILWKTWSWIELESGNKSLAAKRLCSGLDSSLRQTPDNVSASTTYLLKAHQTFSSNMQQLVSTGDVGGAEVQGECLALLAYLTADGCTEPMSSSQGNITATMDRIVSTVNEFKSRGYEGSMAHEKLLQFAARLLYLNATRGPYRRAYLREQLTSFIEYFPQNTIFLSLLEWSDSGLRVVDETRSLLYDRVLIKPHDSMTSRLFAIQHELSHGNANTAKVAFEQALVSEVCRNSVQIWIAYIRFCYGQRDLRRKAKDVFYRALRHCPWSKEVMMEAFGPLIRVMESDELKSVFAMMASKGLRIHVDMENFLEAKRTERSGRH